jgi:hypothetical protein
MSKQQELENLKRIRLQMLKDVGCSKIIMRELANLDLKIRELESEIDV